MSALQNLLTCLRFASVSTDPAHHPEVRACAEWLNGHLNTIGLSSQLHETPGHPIVLARNVHRPGRKTVLIYGHYDVQPAEPLEAWRHPPFEPTEELGRLICRGSSDNKGQFMAHVSAIEQTLIEQGELPLNVILLIEGEEEIGSPNLAPFLAQHGAELACDLVAISDTGMVAPEVGTLTYGLRGIACMEVVVRGPGIDLHSGIFGGVVANPLSAAASLISSLHDADGRVAIEGFYDGVKPIADWERENWSRLGPAREEYLKLTGAPELAGEAGFSERERLWARPTAEINGFGGGWQGEGSKTVIAKQCFFKLSMRLVPGQDPERILNLASEHLRARCPKGITLEIKPGHSGQPYLCDPFSAHGLAAQRALAESFPNHPIALIREGGSIPIVQSFRDILNADTLLLGLAPPDAQAHAPNENFPLATYEAGITMSKALLRELARQG
jgi:acetylornithine deacetylase/succinyl-diaminopimelate desuccinylase-like protein